MPVGPNGERLPYPGEPGYGGNQMTREELAMRMAMANIGKPMAYTDGRLPAPRQIGQSVTEGEDMRRESMNAQLDAMMRRMAEQRREQSARNSMLEQMGERGQLVPQAPAAGPRPIDRLLSMLGIGGER